MRDWRRKLLMTQSYLKRHNSPSIITPVVFRKLFQGCVWTTKLWYSHQFHTFLTICAEVRKKSGLLSIFILDTTIFLTLWLSSRRNSLKIWLTLPSSVCVCVALWVRYFSLSTWLNNMSYKLLLFEDNLTLGLVQYVKYADKEKSTGPTFRFHHD